MKLHHSPIAGPLLLSLVVVGTTGCAVIEGIFKAGVWVGVLSVFLVIGLIIWGIKSLMT